MRFLTVLMLGLGLATATLAETPVPTLTVTGEGEVATAPDMATITLGVTSQAKTAGAAMTETSARTAEMLAALKAAGIAPRDLQTRDLSLQPLWKNRNYSSGEAPEIDGFVAANTVMVRVRDLDGLGTVLDQAVGLGANTFNGLRFGLQDPAPQQDAARKAAVADAMRKAQLYAAAAGLELGPVLSISEAGAPAPAPFMMEAARSSVAAPVEGGEVSLSASVTMVFGIGG
ncbi:SIMPL domain-containing protein [Actibacterium sp. D379-3]